MDHGDDNYSVNYSTPKDVIQLSYGLIEGSKEAENFCKKFIIDMESKKPDCYLNYRKNNKDCLECFFYISCKRGKKCE